MAKRTENLKRQVILGYLSIVVLAIIAIMRISHLITRIVEEEKRDDPAREKAFIITKTLFLLYESETYTQFVYAEDEEWTHFNQTLDQVFEQLVLLKSYTTDSVKWEKINGLELLLAQKRETTGLLLESRQAMEQLYAKHIADGIAAKRNRVREKEVLTEEETQQNTLLIQRQKKGFFKRLAEAFVPIKEDTAIITNSTSRLQTDSLVNEYNPSDTIAHILQKIQADINQDYESLNRQLTERINELRKNNNVISGKINQILFEIEEEELNASLEQEMIKDEIVRNTSKHLAVIAVVSVLIILIFLFLILRDISRLRYYRKQLEEAKQFAEDLLQSREKFMLMISHDIRAPLSSILGCIELLRHNPTEENQEHYLENITILSGHILSLVNDLLDFHRLESGQILIRRIPFSVSALLEEIYAGYKPLTDSKGLTFCLQTKSLPEPCVYVGDPIRIRQAIGNLLSNAIKFTQKGSVSLTVFAESAGEKESSLHISVKDDGPGIAESEQEVIFHDFARLAGTEKVEGFGLGLSITYRLISLMGGSISLNSKVGEGSEFIVQLPLPLSDEEPLTEDREKEVSVVSRNIHCLVIDDDILQLKLTEEKLKRNGVNVVGLSNSGDAITLLKAASFDIILTDIQMPILDGYALLKLIRSSGISGAENIPVIALSASLSEEEEHYVQAGFTGFLNKPFTTEDLIFLLNRLFPPSQQTAALLNMAALTAFAEDDAEASKLILRTFSEETQKSITLLHEALESGDRPQAARLSHKLIPTLSMLEAHALVQQLRILEANVASLTEPEWRETLEDVIAQLTSVVEQTSVE
ncbi:MAG: response regulator [Tannerellaceae bacterium]|jgi:signal transduction histidine kinase/DNA-binding response OmpR family regulator|nr:response regulator [Tannerellaceae bacterium]